MKPCLNFYRFMFACGLIGLLSSCDAIIEPSIAKKPVQTEAPSEGYQSTSYTVNFWWDEVDHALTYHLQVVTPDFNNPGSLVLDTIVKKNTFAFTLSPGNYQWRVLAQNGSSQTPYSTPRNFSVAAGSIKQQAVQLSSPANNLVTNQGPVLFQWSSLYGATKYQLEIDTNNFADENTLVYNRTIATQQYSFSFPKDGVYQWRVKAENDTAQAQWSVVNVVTYDHTPPAAVTLSAPADASTLPLPVNLQWNAASGAIKYKLYVYKSDGTTLYSQSFPMVLTSTSYSFNQGNSGDKFNWTVTALDAAGNESAAVTKRSFTLQ
jgi:hypothetical protein